MKIFRNISMKNRAVLVGIFILAAYGVLAASITEHKIIVMFADVISGLAVIGIAVLMYPVLVSSSKSLSLSYLTLKWIEGLLMIAGGLLFLTVSLQEYRDRIYDLFHLYIFILSAFIFYYLLFLSRVVPRFIAVWGLIAILTLLLKTILSMIGFEHPVLDSMLVLIITNEVFLAVWLMIKGFRQHTEKPSKNHAFTEKNGPAGFTRHDLDQSV